VVQVHCSHRCNVRLVDDSNFQRLRRGDRHTYYGGHFTQFPATIAAPSSGYWNIVLDLGGGSANIRYSFNVLKRAS
jgi:hypothetical protein